MEPALDESLSRLGTDYLDLYLIHWSALKLIIFIAALTQNFRPVAFINGGKQNELDWELTENPYPTWKKLEEMVNKGKVRNIGISKCVPLFNYCCHFIELRYKSCSFNIGRIQNLTANPLKIKPYVNQVELNYWNPQPELLKVRKLFEPFLLHILINMKIVVQRKRYFTGSLFPTWQCRKGQGNPCNSGGSHHVFSTPNMTINSFNLNRSRASLKNLESHRPRFTFHGMSSAVYVFQPLLLV